LSKQYIGFLTQKHLYTSLKKYNQASIDIVFLEEAAEKNHLVPCYFLMSSLLEGQDSIPALVKENGRYQEKTIQVPRVIYNRECNFPRRQRKFKHLAKKGIMVFNETNFLKKYEFMALLEENHEFRKYLPETKIANTKNLKEMMQKYNQLILKPDMGFVGKGIHKLQRINEKQWCLSYQSKEGKRGTWKEITFSDTIPEILHQLIEKNLYLIQNLLPLATYRGAPFDLRVATQRNGLGKWEVSAIIGKVAREGNFLTNIGQGGTSYALDELIQEYPHLSADHLKEQIVALAIKIANLFSSHLPHIADLGFDLAITPEGDIYYIECNFSSAYNKLTTKNGVLLHEGWEAVFTKPVEYARFLLDNKLLD